jgi:hypothetical protein
MTRKQTSPTPAPRIEHLKAGDFKAAALAITGGPWIMQQAWLGKPDKASDLLTPGWNQGELTWR